MRGKQASWIVASCPDDKAAVREAAAVAAEVLLSELPEARSTSMAIATLEREGKPLAIVKAVGTIERLV